MNKDKKPKNLSRRNFLKLSTAAGVGTTLVGLNTLNDPKKSTAYAFDFMVKEHDKMFRYGKTYNEKAVTDFWESE